MAEVEKSDPQLSNILARGSPQFVNETLILNLDTGFKALTKPPYCDVLKKAAEVLGYRVKLVRGVTSFDL